VRLTIATAFGCPYEGEVTPERVLELARRGADLGASEVCLGDTTGMADPRAVHELFVALRAAAPEVDHAVHLHNTRGAGAANLLAAMQAGVRIFDASVGGMGGCPYAPGASGNICTEDMVNMLHGMGVATGVDLDGVIDAARFAAREVGLDLPGQVMRAGPTWPVAPVTAAPVLGTVKAH
jgi:hydroxymethylglutaryl-CoA lyase